MVSHDLCLCLDAMFAAMLASESCWPTTDVQTALRRCQEALDG